MKSNGPSLEEVDLLLDELESVLETPILPPAEEEASYHLYFDFPPQVWQEFLSYCKQNELEPAQQLREAAVSYYRDHVLEYRARKRACENTHLE